jgi:transposase
MNSVITGGNMEFIKGENRGQIILLPESIEEYAEENRTVRIIDAYINSLDLEGLGFSRRQPKETGRPPHDPKGLLQLYLCGYMSRARSSRRLEAESKRGMEAIWLLRKLSPGHRTISGKTARKQ